MTETERTATLREQIAAKRANPRRPWLADEQPQRAYVEGYQQACADVLALLAEPPSAVPVCTCRHDSGASSQCEVHQPAAPAPAPSATERERLLEVLHALTLMIAVGWIPPDDIDDYKPDGAWQMACDAFRHSGAYDAARKLLAEPKWQAELDALLTPPAPGQEP